MGEIAAIIGQIGVVIGAVLGGFTVIGGLVMVIVNARTASIKTDMQNLRDAIETQHKADLCVIDMLREQVNYQAGQIKALSNENNQLHTADNSLRAELETVRKDNAGLRTKVEEQASQITELQRENGELRTNNAYLQAESREMRELIDGYKTGRKKQTGGLRE